MNEDTLLPVMRQKQVLKGSSLLGTPKTLGIVKLSQRLGQDAKLLWMCKDTWKRKVERMTRVFCLNEDCKRVAHLGAREYWNFNGKVRCLRCGEEMEIKVENGKVVSVKRPGRG